MDPTTIGKRGKLFRFDGHNSPFPQPTYVYLVNGSDQVFLVDTHTGPKSMQPIIQEIRACGDKQLVVFNSHFDWDHVWGNCAFASFPNTTIVSHDECRSLLADDVLWESMIENFSDACNGEVRRQLPDKTFTTGLQWENEKIEIFHSPGHTADSSSIYDSSDGVLFVGDNLEDPIPCLSWHRLDTYIETLNSYKNRAAGTLIAAHSGVVGIELIDRNIAYVEAVKDGREPDLPDEEAENMHGFNLKSIVFSRYEELARQELGERFSLAPLFTAFEANAEEPIPKLEAALAACIR